MRTRVDTMHLNVLHAASFAPLPATVGVILKLS